MWSLAPAEDITLPPSGVRLLVEDRIIIIANQETLSTLKGNPFKGKSV
jgi:hypothetical protein